MNAFAGRYDEFLQAEKEALVMMAEADASGNWYTFDEIHRLALEINPRWKNRSNFEFKLYCSKHYKAIRMLFPKFKHKGFYGLKLGITQRYWAADVDVALKHWQQNADNPRISHFETVSVKPGETWVPVKTIANGVNATYYRIKAACTRGILLGVIFDGRIYTDIVEAREYIAWRSESWLQKHWSAEQIEKRLAWQDEVGLKSPWLSDEHTKITVYAPELAHL